MARRFFITDVFHEGPYSGNQLATVIDTKDLGSDEMQKIAREFNFAETTFYMGGSLEAGFDVRIFTPNEEVPFAGHPSLGTAFLIKNLIAPFSSNRLTLNLKVGKIPIEFKENEIIWMKQPEPVFGKTFDADFTANSLNLKKSDIDTRFPPQIVSTGLEFFMVPLTSLAALKKAQLIESPALGTFIFCKESYDRKYALASRMFAPDVGVIEDPATGSANGCLASYILEHNYLDSASINISVAQGFEINRPSTLHLRATKENDLFSINIGGKVRLVAQGDLL